MDTRFALDVSGLNDIVGSIEQSLLAKYPGSDVETLNENTLRDDMRRHESKWFWHWWMMNDAKREEKARYAVMQDQYPVVVLRRFNRKLQEIVALKATNAPVKAEEVKALVALHKEAHNAVTVHLQPKGFWNRLFRREPRANGSTPRLERTLHSAFNWFRANPKKQLKEYAQTKSVANLAASSAQSETAVGVSVASNIIPLNPVTPAVSASPAGASVDSSIPTPEAPLTKEALMKQAFADYQTMVKEEKDFKLATHSDLLIRLLGIRVDRIKEGVSKLDDEVKSGWRELMLLCHENHNKTVSVLEKRKALGLEIETCKQIASELTQLDVDVLKKSLGAYLASLAVNDAEIINLFNLICHYHNETIRLYTEAAASYTRIAENNKEITRACERQVKALGEIAGIYAGMIAADEDRARTSAVVTARFNEVTKRHERNLAEIGEMKAEVLAMHGATSQTPGAEVTSPKFAGVLLGSGVANSASSVSLDSSIGASV